MLERTTTVVVLIWTLGLGSMVLAGDDSHPVCRVLLLEEQSERDDLALEVELADSWLKAYEEIFVLFDGLWKHDAVERMLYLKSKHDRDLAKLEKEHQAVLLERQDALLDQYRLFCSEDASKAAHGRAHTRYLKADCDGLAKRVEIARVDLEYSLVLLDSQLDLRKNHVATRQAVIQAEYEAEEARRRLADGERRVRQCRPDGEAPKPAP